MGAGGLQVRGHPRGRTVPQRFILRAQGKWFVILSSIIFILVKNLVTFKYKLMQAR